MGHTELTDRTQDHMTVTTFKMRERPWPEFQGFQHYSISGMSKTVQDRAIVITEH